MSISALLKTFVSAAVLMLLALSAVNWFITARLDRLSYALEQSQTTAHDVSDLLVLTHEYALYAEERAAQQWNALQSAIVKELEANSEDAVPVPPEANNEAKLLSELFKQLVASKIYDSDLQKRQQNLLLSQLQASSQTLAESIHRWSTTVIEQRKKTEASFRILSITVHIMMLLLLALLAFLLNRRVLSPLAKLLHAVRATANGDLSVRSATGGDDELGELSRTFDAMAIDMVAGLNSEISERKRLEKELQDSLELFSLFLKYSPVYTYIKRIEENQSIVFQLSDNFIDILGIPVEEMPGRNMFEIFPEESARKITDQDLTVLNEGKFLQVEEEINGRIYSTIKFPILRGGGNSFIAGFSIDITERKMAEEEKRQFERQLQHTQKLESLGVLTGGIAHDFNNILAIIIGYCSLTKMDYSKAEKNIPEIEKAAERAAGLCRQMLAYVGRSEFTRSKIDMGMLVDEMITMLKSTLPQNTVIKSELSADIPIIEGDASQISQVVMNLIINASEAIAGEQGEIRVTLARRTATEGQSDKDYNGKEITPGGYLCLEVTDNGCGMDEETKWRIFEPFYTTKFTGRGLGMSAALGIINSHRGALQLYTHPGQGSTFKVYLPLTADQ